MNDIKIKICGLMREKDVESCIRNGVDIVGFVTEYPVEVPWNMDRKRTKELITFFRETKERYGSSAKCCIVSGGDSDKLSGLIEELEPDYLQMHYKEDCRIIREVTGRKGASKTVVIKTVPNDAAERIRQSGNEEPSAAAAAFEESGAGIILVDARGAENAAGSSAKLDEKLYNEVREAVDIPVMAAGGITAENVKSIINDLSPDMIDVMTGVEESTGVKSEAKIEKLIQQIKVRKG